MRITIVTAGSRGDVQPYVALGIGLAQAGYHVTVATHPEFATFVASRGLDFKPVSNSAREALESEEGKAWIASGHNPLTFLRRFRELIEPRMEQGLVDIVTACQDADAIIFNVLGVAAAFVAQVRGVPAIAAYVQPMARTTAFPGFPALGGKSLGPTYNWLTHLIVEQVLWQVARPVVNRWLVRDLGLPPEPFAGPYSKFFREHHLMLFGYSPLVVPKPADWGPTLHVTGYWFLDRPADWQPPAALVDFLAAGPLPVYVGFGSMTNHDPEATTALVQTALRQSGQRGVMLARWGGLGKDSLGDDVIVVNEVPHDWLFPQMRAVVHHGGAGTTSAGLRAGVPAVVAPFFADQPAWAEVLRRLGVAPPPVPQKSLTAPKLARAITIAANSGALRQRATGLGAAIRAEDGVGRAVELIRDYIGPPRSEATTMKPATQGSANV